MGEVVVKEWLDEHRVHVIFAPPRKRPLVIRQRPDHPVPRHGKQHKARPRAPLPIAQQRVGSRRERHRRPKAPDQFARIRRREEQAGVDVAQPERARYSRGGRRLVDDGYDSPCDQIPVLVQSNRNHRLNIQDPLRGVVGADTEIKVVLERHADEVCDGVLSFLSQLLGSGLRLVARFGGVRPRKALRSVKSPQKRSEVR